MANFDFNCTSYLGFSHCGSITAEGYGSINLSDEEVATLINLINEKGTTNVEKLDLKTISPDLFQKLDEAYHQAAQEATINHWYMEGFYEGCYEYDTEELMDFCTENHGFIFEYNEDDYLDDDGELDEDTLYDDKYDAFTEWLASFVESLDQPERIKFLIEHLNAEVDLTDLELDYTVEIPRGVVELAG